MPIYKYKALTDAGVLVEGEEISVSKDELSKEMEARGYLLQHVYVKRSSKFSLFRRQKVSSEQILLFNQQFIALIRAGLTVPEALELASDIPEQPFVSRILLRVLEDVNRGDSLSEACAKHTEFFDSLYISAIRTGEKTGNLYEVLDRYQAYLKRKSVLSKKLTQAMAYPIFLLVTLFVIMAVLFVFVLPRFVAMYADFGANLPLPTHILLIIVSKIYVIAPILVLAIVAIGYFFRLWVSNDRGRLSWDKWKTRLPLIGPMFQLYSIAQLSRTLSTLLSGGTPLVDAMDATAQTLTNKAYAQSLSRAREAVLEGRGLAIAFRENNTLPAVAIKMVDAGEATGNLETIVGEIGAYYEEVLEYDLARLTSLIEPALMLLMGLLVGGIIVVMYLPIFSMADIIG